MAKDQPKPYWIDDLGRKHECYPYGDSQSQTVFVKHRERSLRLTLPDHCPPFAVKTLASSDDLLFLIGEQLEEEDEDSVIIEGGDILLLVARKQEESEDSYWVFVWHKLYPWAANVLGK